MNEWTEAANEVYEEIRVALQTVYNALNQGQQKKILKDAGVKELFDRYGVEYAE
jgi:Fe2+ or Zn2+ uptake regulation protein